MKKPVVAVGISGGVDSSVVACLLKEQGYPVIGFTMAIWDGAFEIDEGAKNACFGPNEEADIEAAAEVCRDLGIRHYIIDLREEYRLNVLEYFKNEYISGRTPNPCVRCNRTMKFGSMLQKARSRGIDFDYFATGHYARIEKNSSGEMVLKKGSDPSRDQSYFLSGLKKEQLSTILFPLGDKKKSDVRELARKYGLLSAERRDSQDFISGGDYSPLFHEDDFKPGDIVDLEGNILGKHKGVIHYTIGQRRGLGISAAKPIYVLKIDAPGRRIVTGEKEYLFSKGLLATDFNLISAEGLSDMQRVKAKIRQAHREADAVLRIGENGDVEIIFDEPQLSVTPGQTVVLYEGDLVLGGGVIESSIDV
jgi:tRNA-uridine 2-sulfurtransferase